MNFYKIKSKIIYHRYRVIRKVIWSIRYITKESFKSDIMVLINITNSYTDLVYGEYKELYCLNNYYTIMCMKEMHERIKLEETINDMHKRLN
jgi:hypothetical protein